MMMYKMSFNGQSDLIGLDFVDGNKGLLYLRYAGPETLVNAAWAFLVSDKARENKYFSQVTIDGPERIGCALYKGVRYKSIKVGLPNGYIDMCLIHPKLTISQDTPDDGFYILTYEDGVPSGFYERLNKTLGIPLKPEWSEWLWIEGQKQQSFTWQVIRSVYENGKFEKQIVGEDDSTVPIILSESLGSVRCYGVHTALKYKHAWHAAIRNHLNVVVSTCKGSHVSS